MMEISITNNNFYMDKFNEIIEQKHVKENMEKKYREEIYLFAREFAEMIKNPQIDKDKNTNVSVKFKIGKSKTLIEKLSDNEIAEYEYITMVIEIGKIFSLNPNPHSSYIDEPFHKLFVKHYNAINDNMYYKSEYDIMNDVLNRLVTIPGFEDFKCSLYNDGSIEFEIPIKNPKYSAPAAN